MSVGNGAARAGHTMARTVVAKAPGAPTPPGHTKGGVECIMFGCAAADFAPTKINKCANKPIGVLSVLGCHCKCGISFGPRENSDSATQSPRDRHPTGAGAAKWHEGVGGGAWTTRPPPHSTAPSAPIPQELEDEMASTIELGALLDMRMARYLRNVDPKLSVTPEDLPVGGTLKPLPAGLAGPLPLQGTLGAKASLRKEPAPDPTQRPPSGRRRTQWFEEKPKVWEWKTLE